MPPYLAARTHSWFCFTVDRIRSREAESKATEGVGTDDSKVHEQREEISMCKI